MGRIQRCASIIKPWTTRGSHTVPSILQQPIGRLYFRRDRTQGADASSNGFPAFAIQSLRPVIPQNTASQPRTLAHNRMRVSGQQTAIELAFFPWLRG